MVRFSCPRVSWIVTILLITTSLDFIAGVPINNEPLQKYDNGGLLPLDNQANKNNQFSQEGGDAGGFRTNGAVGGTDTQEVKEADSQELEDKIPEQSNLAQNNLPQLDNTLLEQNSQESALPLNNEQVHVGNLPQLDDALLEQNSQESALPVNNEQVHVGNLPQLDDALLEPNSQESDPPGNNEQAPVGNLPHLDNNPIEKQDAGNDGAGRENSLPKFPSGSFEQPSENNVPKLGDKMSGSNVPSQTKLGDSNMLGNNGEPQTKFGDSNMLGNNEHPSQSNLPQLGNIGLSERLQNGPPQQGTNNGPTEQSPQSNLGDTNDAGNNLQPVPTNPPQVGTNAPYNGQPIQNTPPPQFRDNSPSGQPVPNHLPQLGSENVENNLPLGTKIETNGQPLQNKYQQLGDNGQFLQNNQQNVLPLNSRINQPTQIPNDFPQDKVPLPSEPIEGKEEDPSRGQEVQTGGLSQGLAADGNTETNKNMSSVENTLNKLGLSGFNNEERGNFNGPIGMNNPQEGQDQSSNSNQGQEGEKKVVGDENYAENWKLHRLAQMRMKGYEETTSTSVMASSTTKPADVMEPWRRYDDSQKEFWEDDNIEDNSDDDEDDDTDDDGDEDEVFDKQYTEDGYLDAPADNVDNVGRPVDKTDEETNRNSNNYDESSDANQNNQNIMDDNNEQAVYNNGVNPLGGEKDPDEDYNLNRDQEGEDTYEEKIDRIDSDLSTPSTPDEDDDEWYDDTDDNEDESDIIGGEDEEEEEGDVEDTVVDEEALFNMNHPKHPFTGDDDNPIYFNNLYPKLKEGLVEYKMIQNRSSINAPSSMVLFYTWIILIVLIAVVTFSAFRYRCKGMLMNGSRNYRNGNHGNYKNGEENKNLLENVYA